MGSKRVAAYAAIYGFWGASFLAIREIVAVAPPLFSAAFRFTAAGLILYIWTRLRGASNPTWVQLKWSAILGFIMFSLNYGCLFWAEERVASGYAAIIAATIPVWIFLGEWLALRALKPTAAAIAGVMCGLAGTALVVLPGSGAGSMNAPALALLIGAIAWSVGAIWSRKLPIPRSSLESAGLQMGLGGAMLLAVSGAVGEFPRLRHALDVWNWRLTLDMAYLILCASIAAFTAFLYLMNREPATRVASSSYVNPVVAVILGATIAGERLTALQLGGAGLVVGGVFFTLRGKMPRKQDQPRFPNRARHAEAPD